MYIRKTFIFATLTQNTKQMNIKSLFACLFLLTACLSYAHAQHESDSVALTNVKEIAAPGIDTTIYNNVEKMPSFPGGEFKMYEFLAMNILQILRLQKAWEEVVAKKPSV